MNDDKLDTEEEIVELRADALKLALHKNFPQFECLPKDLQTSRKAFRFLQEVALRRQFCGAFGLHEALHLAYVYGETVAEYLENHPAVLFDETAFYHAHRAWEHLFELYQHLGRAKCDVEDGTNEG